MNKAILSICIAVLMIAIIFSGCNEENKKTTPTVKSNIIYVDEHGGKDYINIQDAIDAAKSGGTVYVYNGIYNENININKTINFIGEDKNTTIINCNGYGNALNISADYVNISGFAIEKSKYSGGIGIYSNFSSITKNIISNNYDGMYFVYSSNNVISDNIIINNSYGIDFWDSSKNTISGNTIIDNNYGGILFEHSGSNVISGNTISNNSYFNINFRDSSYNVISCNIISTNNHYGISFDFSTDNVITGNTINNSNLDSILFEYDSNHNAVCGNNISNSGSGISFNSVSHNVISGNTISNNSKIGIFIYDYSNNNTISGNTIQNNKQSGINIVVINYPSNNNIIYHNNLINNTENANDSEYNIWYNITLKEGNYWSDYNGTDSNSDGIGDTPYNIPGENNNQDKYPLMNPVDI